MPKDFRSWFGIKPKIEERKISDDFHIEPGEIWWCSIGENVGIETDGKDSTFSRPVLVIKVFNKEHIWIVPLTSNLFGKFRVPVDSFSSAKSAAIISQLRTISSRRLRYFIKNTTAEEISLVKAAIIDLLK